MGGGLQGDLLRYNRFKKVFPPSVGTCVHVLYLYGDVGSDFLHLGSYRGPVILVVTIFTLVQWQEDISGKD